MRIMPVSFSSLFHHKQVDILGKGDSWAPSPPKLGAGLVLLTRSVHVLNKQHFLGEVHCRHDEVVLIPADGGCCVPVDTSHVQSVCGLIFYLLLPSANPLPWPAAQSCRTRLSLIREPLVPPSVQTAGLGGVEPLLQ